ncbi:winged helix-turn-helix transcriptional regulator [Streptomyces sp. GQFP]|uniref:winged helix-turn-helix transcriptional regulator n=1 Tax=Streptomyces sp. GQFP TaxID=2907545 RepID=UPI001F1BD120|nr:winged helix-turn-helix transcriptional regulator [Streptomyces sp. GQFP]UIX34304.1 winged helix-turn-helix transcriptional regulator [Streptomyces sp. GQFP]
MHRLIVRVAGVAFQDSYAVFCLIPAGGALASCLRNEMKRHSDDRFGKIALRLSQREDFVPDRIGRWRRRGSDGDQGRQRDGSSEYLQRNPEKFPTADSDRFLQGIHDVRHLISGEWTWDVLVTLHGGPLHYTILLDAIQSKQNGSGWPGKKHNYLRDGTLNRTLRRLEQGDLVKHNRETEFPYRSAYELTPPAKELLTAMVPVVVWAESNADLVEHARQRRRAEKSGGD